MRARVGIFVLLAVVSLTSSKVLWAQGVGGGIDSQGFDSRRQDLGNQAQKVVAGKVYTLKGDPLAHATVELSNNAGAPYRVLLTDNNGEFYYQYQFYWETEEVKHFTVTLRVSKKGFEPAHKIAEIAATPTGKGIPVTLRPLQPEDPTLLSRADLIKDLAPRLRNLGPADGLLAAEEKDYARGVQDFLDRGHLDEAVPLLTKVSKLSPNCRRCRTMLALAELSWGDWGDAHDELAKLVNAMIDDPKLGVAETFIAEGELLSWDEGPAKASAYFGEALNYAPQDPLALQEHGRMQCLDLDWEGANVSLKKALAAGAWQAGELMYAEALLWTQTPEDAEAEFNLYLNGRNPKSMPPRVRALWDRIQSAKKDRTIIMAAKAKAQARGEVPLDYIHNPPKNLPDFEPATDQAQLDAVLAAVGKNVSDLFANLPNISSMEAVHQEKLTRKGKTDTAKEFKYRYLMLAPEQPYGPSIDEHRADAKGEETPQLGLSDNSMLTSGFVAAPLVFHPAYQQGSVFRLLGMQKIKGRKTFVVAYAQDPSKSRLAGSFQQGAVTKLTYTQGMAWVDAENYQIVRLTTDLLNPLPMVRLDKETTEIDFNEVHFNKVAQNFWLPQAVTVTLDWNGKLLRNEHAYSDFMVFNVDSSQKIGTPKGADKPVEETPEPAASPNPLEKHSLSLVPPAKTP